MEGSAVDSAKAGAAWRVVAVLLFLTLGFACAVMIAAMIDISGTPTCHDVDLGKAVPSDGQCFGGSSLQKTLALALGFPSGAIAGLAALGALVFAITGRWGRLALALAAAAIALGVLSIVIGSV